MKFRVLLIVLLITLLFWWFFINPLPEGVQIASSLSPNGKYQVNAYLCDGGATVDQAIRAEVMFLDSGKSRNIYWQYHAYDAQIQWISDDQVVINDITLNIFHDMYDYRKQ